MLANSRNHRDNGNNDRRGSKRPANNQPLDHASEGPTARQFNQLVRFIAQLCIMLQATGINLLSAVELEGVQAECLNWEANLNNLRKVWANKIAPSRTPTTKATELSNMAANLQNSLASQMETQNLQFQQLMRAQQEAQIASDERIARYFEADKEASSSKTKSKPKPQLPKADSAMN